MTWKVVYTTDDLADAAPEAVDGTAAAVGSASDVAREDHVHALGPLVANLACATNKITGLGAPSGDTDAATKGYVDGLIEGLSYKGVCDAVAVANVAALSGTTTIDDVSLVADDVLLLTAQSSADENGPYVIAAGAWTRPDNFAIGSGARSSFWFISEGTTYADTRWVCTDDAGSDVVDTDNLTIVQFGGAADVTAGDGLSKAGNTIDVNVDDSGIEISADTLQLKAGGITNVEVNAGAAISLSKLDWASVQFISIGDNTDTEVYIEANIGNGTEPRIRYDITSNAWEMRAEGGGYVAIGSSSGDIEAVTTNAGSGLTGGVTSGDAVLQVVVDDDTIEISTNTLQVKADGIGTTELDATVTLDFFAAPTGELDFNEQEVLDFRLKGYTTAGRPTPSNQGVMIYDTDLDRPMIWVV